MKTPIIEVIKTQNFTDLISDVNEVILDSFLEDGLVKDIPIFGLFFKGKNFVSTIQDKLFYKKMFTFLKELENTSSEDRKKETEKIDKNPNYRTKVGEKLLFIINENNDCEKSKYIGILFKKFINQNLNYDDFIRLSNCINKTNIIDLNNFINDISIETSLQKNSEAYLNTGLITQTYYDSLETTYKTGLRSTQKTGIYYKPSNIGTKIRSFLRTK
ncbi:hypothetical protein [Chryseobacterium sp. 5_R23647]|uniref:hypothetical protein n=1 Tax=Chryseobacterium sp. 5_R23647 TaxID=2258964 RepID=UPI000E25FE79|nr:hypothetical protein [Chryseobacterium sp. 5_R23647]REC42440.1 hypothetical protein DRF69_11670 [Chryseobacterium sp. 5_R23647]